MPLANFLDDIIRSRSSQELFNTVKRVVAPSSSVMRGMGPASARLANDMAGIDDDMMAGLGRYVGTHMPIDEWEKIPQAKRIQAGYLKHGWLNPTETAQAQADPDIMRVYSGLKGTFDQANAENLAARDPQGNPLQVRDSWTGAKRDYEPIADDYFPGMIKPTKRNSIVQPYQYAQAEVERNLTNETLGKLGLDTRTTLDPDTAKQIQTTAEDAIDEYFRTGQANQYVKDKRVLDTLAPAYKSFREITDHLRGLQVAKAQGRGQPIPPEIDPIIQLFGSDDPQAQKSGIRMFREYLLNDARNARRMGNIESSRALPLPRDWYEMDPLKVGPLYVMRQQRRLAEIARFGQNNEGVLDPNTGLLAQIPDERDREFAKKIFDRHMGLEPYNKSLAMNKVMDAIFAGQVIKLGTAQISQLVQIMNSIMETGLGPTWSALSDLGKSKQIALKSGAALSRVMDVVREGITDPLEESGARKFSEGFLKWTGFSKADLIARHIGAGAGYAHGQEILRRAVTNPNDIKALREIRRLSPGMSASPNAFQPILDKIGQARGQLGNKPTLEQIEQFFQDELLGIARTASLNANFRQTILDLPGWATTPMGRMVNMFRTFAYKQTLFVGNRILEDLREGNPRPFIGLAAGAGVIGPAVELLKSIPQGRLSEVLTANEEALSDPEKAAKKAFENIATVGALGMFDQTARAMRRGETGWFEFMAGPFFSDLANSFGGAGQVAYGAATGDEGMAERGVNKFGRFVSGRIPVVGAAVSDYTRAAMEDVERRPGGLVTRGQTQPLGTESPPVEFMGMTLPSPRILFGLEQSVTSKRKKYMEELKDAVAAKDRAKMGDVLKRARADGVVITGTSLRRLVSENALEERAR